MGKEGILLTVSSGPESSCCYKDCTKVLFKDVPCPAEIPLKGMPQDKTLETKFSTRKYFSILLSNFVVCVPLLQEGL